MSSIVIRRYDIRHKRLNMDNKKLARLIKEKRKDVETKKRILERNIKKGNKRDRLTLSIARLKYIFAKEQLDLLLREARVRELSF